MGRAMGQQIVMLLSLADEQRLMDHLTRKFPHCRIVNEVYPGDWDRRTGSGDTLPIIDGLGKEGGGL
jgi:hypothetical protein